MTNTNVTADNLTSDMEPAFLFCFINLTAPCAEPYAMFLETERADIGTDTAFEMRIHHVAG